MYDEDDIITEFKMGVSDYWGGELPENWKNAELRAKSPYLSGWYMASMWENYPGWLLDADEQPFQEEE